MINLTGTLIFLVPALQLIERYPNALARLIKSMAGTQGSKSRFFKRFISYRPPVDEIYLYMFELLDAAIADRQGELSRAEIVVLTRLGLTSSVGGGTRTHANLIIKIFLMGWHKTKCLLLPYRFTRPLVPWVDDIPDQYACYTTIIRAFRALDVTKATGTKDGPEYDPQERKVRTAFQMGVKLALASTWYEPEDITLDDFRKWRGFSLDASVTNSPLPLENIAEILKNNFGSRFKVDPQQVREGKTSHSRDAVHRLLSRGEAGLLESSFASYSDPLELINYLLTDLKLAAVSFFGDGIERLNLGIAWAKSGVKVIPAIQRWAKLQKEYVEVQSYENHKGITTAFGRFNIYLFVYLPAWFNKNPSAQLIYPDSPNKFIGQYFYKHKVKLDGNYPLTYFEFSETLGFDFYYSIANNLKLFFGYLVDFCPGMAGCEGLVQPIWWLPSTKKSSKTNKLVFTSEHEGVYIKYLEALESAEPFLDKYVREMRYRYSNKEVMVIDFNDVGYVPIVYLESGLKPILSISRKALILFRFAGEYYYNPATIVMPYCLLRAGLRGQNLQWLSADSYAIHVDREVDHQVGLSYLFVNTDKIRTEPFTVHCRYEVISRLDRQAKWREAVFERLGAEGFRKSYPYEGKAHSKWGEISCLFCNDPFTGAPVNDVMYSQAITYSQLDFQSWMRTIGRNDIECAVFMGSPREVKSRKTAYYTWEQWQVARGKSAIVKVSVHTDSEYGDLSFCPVRVRSKMTGHSGRATHITQLLSRLSPEEVAKTTGQSAKTVMHYDTGADDFRRRFAGVINTKEPLKRPLIKRPDVEQQLQALLSVRGSGDISSVINDFGLLNFSDPDDVNEKEPGAFEIIAKEKSASLGQSSTHICVRGFICPGHILQRFKGRKICPWCTLAVWSLNSIFAVSAKRHQLADEFERIQAQVAQSKDKLSTQEMIVLEGELKALSEELIAWYFLERTLDSLIFKRGENSVRYSHVVGDKSLVVSEITRHVVERGSGEDFLRRLDEAVEFPTTMSIAFRDKVNRAIRLVMAQRGNVYEALMEPVPVNPETRLAALLRDEMNAPNFDIGKLIWLLEVADLEWFKHVAETRGIEGGDDSDL